MNVNGGQATQCGGGGAGGRIAVHARHRIDYGGRFRSSGGSGSNSNHGGPGTIYTYQSRRGPQYREIKYNLHLNTTDYKPEHSKIMVDNEGKLTTSYGVMMDEEKEQSVYDINEFYIGGKAHLQFYHPSTAKNLSVYAREVLGDKTGVIRVNDRQSLFVFIVQSTHTYMDAPCGFYVSDYAEVVLPSEVILRGEDVTLRGRMRGCETLVVERGGNIVIQGKAHTADIGDEADWFKSHPFYPFTEGLFKVPKLSVKNSGSFKVEMNPVVPVLEIAELNIKKGKFYVLFLFLPRYLTEN